jgi:hypothetical protein
LFGDQNPARLVIKNQHVWRSKTSTFGDRKPARLAIENQHVWRSKTSTFGDTKPARILPVPARYYCLPISTINQ